MGYLKEKVAYLQGMAEGIQLSETTGEGKLLKAIIDVLEDFALTVEDVEEVQEELSEQVDTIDEDLSEIERLIFDEGDDSCECGCNDEEDDEDEEEESIVEIECPYCNEQIEVDIDMLDDEESKFECPACHKDIEFSFECDCEDCKDEEE